MRSLTLMLCVLALGLSGEALAKKKKAGRPAPVRSAPVMSPGNDSAPASDPAPAADSGGGTPVRGPARIDFDDRLIQGQSNKSGSVYLYDRKELKIRSMLKKRESFREEIIGSLYDS